MLAELHRGRPLFPARSEGGLLARWRRAEPDVKGMNQVNPLFVPREWMLVEAYEAAERGDNSVIETLQRLFDRPYADDHDPARR